MAASLEHRIAKLEQQVARLQQQNEEIPYDGREWVEDLYGAFTGDPVFEEAMKLGRAYRKSTLQSAPKIKARR